MTADNHDSRCEQMPNFHICHCRKRQREAAGIVTLPTEDLDFPPPSCPNCYGNLQYDDGWHCPSCHISWDGTGRASSAYFHDEYGDLDAEVEQWKARYYPEPAG